MRININKVIILLLGFIFYSTSTAADVDSNWVLHDDRMLDRWRIQLPNNGDNKFDVYVLIDTSPDFINTLITSNKIIQRTDETLFAALVIVRLEENAISNIGIITEIEETKVSLTFYKQFRIEYEKDPLITFIESHEGPAVIGRSGSRYHLLLCSDIIDLLITSENLESTLATFSDDLQLAILIGYY